MGLKGAALKLAVVMGVLAMATATVDDDLETAAKNGDTSGATTALSGGADVNLVVEYNGLDVPVLAVCSSAAVANVLLGESGINVNLAPDTSNEFTALHVFAATANVPLLNALRSASVTPTLAVDQLTANGKTALMLTASPPTLLLLGSPVDAAEEVLQAGADVSVAMASTGQTVVHLAIDAIPDDAGVADTRVALLSKLISNGASVTTKTLDGDGALHLACNPAVGNADIVQTILGASTADLEVADGAGDKPIHIALEDAGASNFATVEGILSELLAESPDLSALGARSKSPLHLAAASGQPSLVTALLNAGARDNVVDGSNGLAIHEAAGYYAVTDEQCADITTIAEALVDVGEADLAATNSDGETALEIAETAPANRRCLTLERALGSSITFAPSVAPTDDASTPSAAASLGSHAAMLLSATLLMFFA